MYFLEHYKDKNGFFVFMCFLCVLSRYTFDVQIHVHNSPNVHRSRDTLWKSSRKVFTARLHYLQAPHLPARAQTFTVVLIAVALQPLRHVLELFVNSQTHQL